MAHQAHVCPACSRPLPADAPAGTCPRCLLAAGFASADGAPEVEGLSARDIAPHFPELEVLQMLGRGGMGVVYKARQRSLDRLVALKILPVGAHDSAEAAAFEDRFQREARALARLHHPRIVAVHEFGERDGLYFLLMEYVDGCNLREAMRSGRFTPEQALAIVPQICDALSFAHGKGVVHRDIKPENVLIAKDGSVKIADFGLAKLVQRSPADATLTRAGQVMGTPHYMAPEQIESPTQVDHRADIYSLGVVFYEMLTGELPIGRFDAPSQRVAVDVQLDQVVLRALEKQPDRRYQSADEMNSGVTSIGVTANGAAASGRGADTPASPRPSQPRGRMSRLAIAGVLGVPVAFALLMGLYAVQGDGTLSPVALVSVILAGMGGWAASIVSWVRIRGSGGALRGLPLAVIGTIAPLVICVPGGVAVLFWASVARPLPHDVHGPTPERAVEVAPDDR